jgi:hypothetical protein
LTLTTEVLGKISRVSNDEKSLTILKNEIRGLIDSERRRTLNPEKMEEIHKKFFQDLIKNKKELFEEPYFILSAIPNGSLGTIQMDKQGLEMMCSEILTYKTSASISIRGFEMVRTESPSSYFFIDRKNWNIHAMFGTYHNRLYNSENEFISSSSIFASLFHTIHVILNILSKNGYSPPIHFSISGGNLKGFVLVPPVDIDPPMLYLTKNYISDSVIELPPFTLNDFVWTTEQSIADFQPLFTDICLASQWDEDMGTLSDSFVKKALSGS